MLQKVSLNMPQTAIDMTELTHNVIKFPVENTEPHIIVTGGSGYVGGHVCKALSQAGYTPINIDRIRSPWSDTYGPYYCMSFTPSHHAIHDAVKKFNVVAVIHCAANSLVGPSVTTPAMYYENNVTNTLYMLDFLYAQGINKIVFSSSSSVYGDQEIVPIKETANLKPLTSYGRSKQMVEGILHDYSTAYNMRSVSLRYFNACGADFDGGMGQVKDATHVIARVLESIINDSIFSVYGENYNTPDGTPIRDYTHVWDLALAHVLSVKYLEAGGETGILNLGAGQGQSVKDILNATKTVIGKLPIIEYKEARPGDPTRVIADISKAKEILDWSPKYSDLNTIIDSAWGWYNSDRYRGLNCAN